MELIAFILITAWSCKHLNNELQCVVDFFFFFSDENQIATVQIIGFKVDGIPIFHSVDPIVSVCFCWCFSWEDSRSYTYPVMVRLNDFTFFLYDWCEQRNQKPRASFIYFFSSNHLPLCYYWISLPIWYMFFSSFASSITVHFTQICGFRMFNAVDRKQFTYIISFFFFVIFYICKVV